MKGQQAQTPLKVCPSCSVATRTQSDTCPSCGRRYGGGGVQSLLPRRWSWWFAIPIVVVAFAVGYFGLSRVVDEDSDGEGITLEQGAAVPDRISRSSLEGHLGGESPVLVESRKGEDRVRCAYYPLTDQPDSVWEFCFERDELFSSAPVGGSGSASESELSVPPPARRSGDSGRRG